MHSTVDAPAGAMRGRVCEVAVRPDVTGAAQAGAGAGTDRTATVGDFDRLAALDPAEKLAGALPELSDPDRLHVLLIAHWQVAKKLIR